MAVNRIISFRSKLIFILCGLLFGCSTSGKQPFRVDSFMADRKSEVNQAKASSNRESASNSFTMTQPASNYLVNNAKKNPKSVQDISGKKKKSFPGIKTVATSIGKKFRLTDSKTTNVLPDDPTSLSYKPKDLKPELFLASAALFEKQGAVDKALGQYERALKISPTNRSALIGLARLQHRQGDMDESLATYQKALKNHPNDAVIHNDLGLCLLRSGKIDAAVASLTKAVNSNPANSMYQNNLAAAYVAANRVDEAVNMLTSNYGPAVAHYNVGYLLQQRGNIDGAYDYFAKSLAFDPNLQHARTMIERIQPMLTNRPEYEKAYETTKQQSERFQQADRPRNDIHRVPLSFHPTELQSAQPIESVIEVDPRTIQTAALGIESLDDVENDAESDTDGSNQVMRRIADLISIAASADEDNGEVQEPTIKMPMTIAPAEGQLEAPLPTTREKW